LRPSAANATSVPDAGISGFANATFMKDLFD